jgi:ubiquinone/menaquinone biosynthesis C-methylase UbiE
MTGVDLTPAMLEQARQSAREAGLANVAFTRADVNALPFADQSIGLVVCGYSLHHFLGPAQVVKELGRVIVRGGQLAAIDMIVPAGADQEAHNRIERARDNSHATTLTADEIQALFETAGLRIVRSEIHERPRQFADWMQIAGWAPETPAYDETFRLMEASIPGDIAGFHPRLTAGAESRLEFVQTSLFVIGEKL